MVFPVGAGGGGGGNPSGDKNAFNAALVTRSAHRRKVSVHYPKEWRYGKAETLDKGGFRDTLKQEFTRSVWDVNNGWDAAINPRGNSILGYLGLGATRSAPFSRWLPRSTRPVLSKIYQANSRKILRWKHVGVARWTMTTSWNSSADILSFCSFFFHRFFLSR